MEWCVLQEGYWAERQLHAGKFVELVFHAKGEQQWLPSGAGQPPLGWPAWGCGHLATAFAWTLWIFSWSRWKLRSPNGDS